MFGTSGYPSWFVYAIRFIMPAGDYECDANAHVPSLRRHSSILPAVTLSDLSSHRLSLDLIFKMQAETVSRHKIYFKVQIRCDAYVATIARSLGKCHATVLCLMSKRSFVIAPNVREEISSSGVVERQPNGDCGVIRASGQDCRSNGGASGLRLREGRSGHQQGRPGSENHGEVLELHDNMVGRCDERLSGLESSAH